MFSDEELDIILDAVGIPGTLAGGVTVRGKFTQPARNVQVFEGEMSSLDPRFVIKISDQLVQNIDIGTTITIKGTAYAVIDTEERNDGFVGLPLTKA
jgi:hypothetical protein